MNGGSWYPLLALVGIGLSAFVWTRLLRRGPVAADGRLPLVYLAALIGALLGAKVVYILAEGVLLLRARPIDWGAVARDWIVGKTVVGALLGGYASVEIAKWMLSYRSATGDLFAVVAPMGLMLGRVGCLLHGCCLGQVCEPAWYTLKDAQGIERWPAVPLELGFNAVMFLFALAAWRRGWFKTQLFHVYLMAYAMFRFAHEFERATPRLFGPFSGYHIAAAALFVLGAGRYWQRARNAGAERDTLRTPAE